jgi:structure-specific recognition protein 1
MRGPLFEVFARTLRGLSAAKITRPGNFRNALGDGFAVRCSYKVGGVWTWTFPKVA